MGIALAGSAAGAAGGPAGTARTTGPPGAPGPLLAETAAGRRISAAS
ncbi:Uncharacterised protein [Bordetella pseudohinzii]|uniref:Uncharacterized protein n=1 Tax=Bordetella pseudohinzii TaxID=1331258 RepID=A0A0M7D6L4_9BORD|nr:Uncharacterised protein [Bordetella pseudohinzii]